MNVREYETDLRDAARALLQGAVFTGVPDPSVFGESLRSLFRAHIYMGTAERR
jgi:peptidyl-prolyl cis-trans isomerase D